MKRIDSDGINITLEKTSTALPEAIAVEGYISYPNLIKKILKLAGPYTAAQLISMVGNAAIIKIFAELGQKELAASGLVGSVQTILISIPTAVFIAVAILAGREKGGSNPMEVGVIYRQGLLLAGLVSLPLMVITSFAGPILAASGYPSDLSELAQDYLRGTLLGLPFSMGFAVNTQLALGLSHSTFAAITLVSTTVFYTVFGAILAFGLLNVPRLGIAGMGIGVSTSSFLNFVASALYLKYNPHFKPYDLFSLRANEGFNKLKELVRTGAFIVLQSGAEIASLAVAGLYLGRVGINALIAQQIVLLYFYIGTMPYTATSQALIGYMGEIDNNPLLRKNIFRYGNIANALCVAISAMVLATFCIFPRALASLVIDVEDPANKQMVELSKYLFIIHGIELVIDSTRNINTGVLRGINDANFPAWVTFCTTVICLGLGYILGFPFGLGAVGIYAARDVGLMVGAVLLYWRFINKCANITNTAEASPLTDESYIKQGQHTCAYWSKLFLRNCTPCHRHASITESNDDNNVEKVNEVEGDITLSLLRNKKSNP